ncbi:biotin/lipoyl-binding protein, partial [Paraburkholderia sp. SIMBA_055]
KDAEIAKIQAEKGSVAAKVPADGKIIQTNVKENQMVQAGQQIATEVDMKDLFIVANIKPARSHPFRFSRRNLRLALQSTARKTYKHETYVRRNKKTNH